MKRFFSLFIQDLILSYRSGHVLITVVLLVLMLAVVLLLPREIKLHNEIILDTVPGTPLAFFLTQKGIPSDILHTDAIDFRTSLDKQPNKVGVIFSGSLKDPHFEIITQTIIAEENIGLLKASLDQVILEMQGIQRQTLPVSLLREAAPPPPFNLNAIPIILVFEVVLLGFFISSIMMFQEKQEGTLLAYRVTPSGALSYIISKSALFLVLSMLYGVPILLVGFGFNADYPLLLLLIILSSLLMTLFSLAVAVFFRSLSEWFFIGIAILIINSIPMVSYAYPSFGPAWITWIPSYPALFSVRNVLFHNASFFDVSPDLLYLVVINELAFIAAFAAIRYKLLREGR
jgi:hypothetical protein